jgi:hypothetical protein
MPSRWPVSVAACLLLALTVTFGCAGGNSSATPTGPSPTAKSTQGTNALTVDPVTLRPEFLPGAACNGFSPFATHFRVFVVPSPLGRFVNAISFSFLDSRGVRVVPFAVPGPVEGGITSTGMPSAGPILVPGQISSIFFVNPSSPAVMPFAIRFDCGYAPLGLLSIGVQMTDQLGRPIVAQVGVKVGG